MVTTKESQSIKTNSEGSVAMAVKPLTTPWLGFARLVCADLCMAFMWVYLNSILRVLVDVYLAFYDDKTRQMIKRSNVVGLLFFFYSIKRITGDASYNPLTVISYTAANITPNIPLYVLSLRIPAQIVGAVCGATVATSSVPETYKSLVKGPSLRSSPHTGAMVEGTLTFLVVFIILTTILRGPKSEIQRTWITSISRVSLSMLGTEYTGPSLNPANAFGWAFLKNQHNTWEHLYVYWISPFLATVAAAWIVKSVFGNEKKAKVKQS